MLTGRLYPEVTMKLGVFTKQSQDACDIYRRVMSAKVYQVVNGNFEGLRSTSATAVHCLQVRMLVTDAHVAAMTTFAEGQHSSKLPAVISARRFITRAHETRFDSSTIICSNPTCCAPRGKAPYKNCSSCMAMPYCTVACQRAHWRLHKAQCSGAAKIAAGRVAVRAEGLREAATELLTQVIAQNLPMMRWEAACATRPCYRARRARPLHGNASTRVSGHRARSLAAGRWYQGHAAVGFARG